MNTSNAIRIRDAEPIEHDALRQVTLAAYQQYAGVMPHWHMYKQHLSTTLTSDQQAARIVAELRGEVVGSVLLAPPTTSAGSTQAVFTSWPQVRLLAVAPIARGVGVGAALLDECVRRARHGGATRLGLHTEDLMEVAMGMYIRKGFVRAPEFDFMPAPGVLVKAYQRNLGDGTVEPEPG